MSIIESIEIPSECVYAIMCIYGTDKKFMDAFTMRLTNKQQNEYLQNPRIFDGRQQFVKYGRNYNSILTAIMYGFREACPYSDYEPDSDDEVIEPLHKKYDELKKEYTHEGILIIERDLKLLQEIRERLTRPFICKVVDKRLKITFSP